MYCIGGCTNSKPNIVGNYAPCAGKKECENNSGSGLCECGGKKYFDECSERCTGENSDKYDDTPLGSCGYAGEETGSSWWVSGYYPVGLKCIKQNGVKMYCISSCTNSKPDIVGNYAPCAGKKECERGLYALGDLCTCGGKTYGTECGTVCNYEDTPERCAALGKSFSQKCADSSGNLFGQCI